MKIWIERDQAYGNLGDEAMLQMAVSRLKELFPGCQLVVASQAGSPIPDIGPCEIIEPPATYFKRVCSRIQGNRWLRKAISCLCGKYGDVHAASFATAWPALLSKEDQDLLRQIRSQIDQCDFYYGVGAANINDVNDFPLRYCIFPRAWIIREFAKRGKATVLSCQTLGPLKTKTAARLVSQIVENVTHLTLRDPSASLSELQRLGISSSKIEAIGDEAFTLPSAPPDVVSSYLTQQGIGPDEPFILFHLRETNYVGAVSEQNPLLVKLLRNLAQRRRVLLCPMCYSSDHADDTAFARRIVESEDYGGQVIAGDTIRDAALVRGLVDRCHSVVALSYHLQVFAISAAKPFICLVSGIYYQHKVKAVQGWVDSAFHLSINLDQPNTDPQETCDRLEELWNDYREHLQQVSQNIRSKQDGFFARLVPSLGSN